jgi:hypothetical protein
MNPDERRAMRVLHGGIALAGAGVVGLVVVVVVAAETVNMSDGRGLDWVELVFGIARLVLVIGALLVVGALVVRQGQRDREAYRMGFDIGYEKGFRESRHERATS